MLSHDLAKLLLSRRNNDLVFSVEVALDGADDGDRYTVEMEDDRQRAVSGKAVKVDSLLTYDSQNDRLVLELATIFTGEPAE